MSRVLIAIKELGHNHIYNTIVKIFALLAITAAIVSVIISVSYSENLNRGLSNNLIRLHVIANSDSPEDQALKRDVRDIVINYMRSQLKDSQNAEETKNIINSDIDRIEELARDEISNQGKNYNVKAMLGNYPFPTKAYGDITLPAGDYQALRIVIGKGEGANWWCVLFPPLCFVDASHGTIPDSVKQDLKDALSEEEYRIVASAEDDDDIPVKVKFKVVEFFQDSKIKFSGVISRIFSGAN